MKLAFWRPRKKQRPRWIVLEDERVLRAIISVPDIAAVVVKDEPLTDDESLPYQVNVLLRDRQFITFNIGMTDEARLSDLFIAALEIDDRSIVL